MKKCSLTCSFLAVFLLITAMANSQKTISEGTLTYSIEMKTPAGTAGSALDGATSTVYLKGSLSRTDMVSSLGNEKTIYDNKAGTAVILKEYSGQKLMITLTNENWIAKNKKTAGIQFTRQSGTKEILGYACDRATATLTDGSTLNVYYATGLDLLNKDYDPAFKNLPGVPMQYEFTSGKNTFTYTLTRLDVSAVQVSRFEVPKSGYRVITYNDNQRGAKEK
jgi:GLPGLI family protein